jgi:hypothetical protein
MRSAPQDGAPTTKQKGHPANQLEATARDRFVCEEITFAKLES